jgi:hypothetical protein
MDIAANQGWQAGDGGVTVYSTTTSGHSVCVEQTGTTKIAGGPLATFSRSYGKLLLAAIAASLISSAASAQLLYRQTSMPARFRMACRFRRSLPRMWCMGRQLMTICLQEQDVME